LSSLTQTRPAAYVALCSALAIMLAMAGSLLATTAAQAHSAAHGAHARQASSRTAHGHSRKARRHSRRAHGKHHAKRPSHRHVGHTHGAGAGSSGSPSAPVGGAASGSTGSVPEEAPGGAAGTNSAPRPSVSCDLIAAPGGSDSHGNGSLSAPYQSLAKLDGALEAGETGCLRGGTYGSTSTHHNLSNDGTPTGQITLTAYPGEAVTVVGWVDLEASYTTLAGLSIDGSNTFYKKTAGAVCPTPTVVSESLDIAGTGDVFERNNYYQSVPGLRGNGIGIGFWGDTDNTTIRFNRIHDVGQCTQHDHLIYLASGNNVQIYDNWLYNDHNGFGVTVYPHPTNARIFSNVIDNAGSGLNFGDMAGSPNSGNQAWHNVVTNSFRVPGDTGHPLAAALVMSPELGASSTGNAVFENDSFENPDGISAVNHVSAARLSLTGNISVDPRYIDAAAANFDIASGSPAASWGLWNGN
jgi:hypothetical protein